MNGFRLWTCVKISEPNQFSMFPIGLPLSQPHHGDPHLRCPVALAMRKKGTFFLLVEFEGEPLPKKGGKHGTTGQQSHNATPKRTLPLANARAFVLGSAPLRRYSLGEPAHLGFPLMVEHWSVENLPFCSGQRAQK